MIIDATIQQLRTYCPLLGGRVAGTADFRQGLENYNAALAQPAGYVVPLDQDSDGNTVMIGLIQVVTKRIGVIVEFDARADRRGQWPTMNYDLMEAGIMAAILNWRPVECRTLNQQGFWFHGGRFLDLDRARLFYQWEFALNWQITDDDGWHDPDYPLVSVEVDIFKVPPQDMTVDQPAAIIKVDTLSGTLAATIRRIFGRSGL